MKLGTFALAVTLLLASSFCRATSYDATASFSTTANPNGVWSYGYSRAGEPSYSFASFTDVGVSVLGPYWHRASYGVFPLVSKNQTGGALENILPGQLYLHPGPSPFQDLAILRFTAPAPDTYFVSGQFYAGAPGEMSGAVYMNGSLLQSFPVTTDGSMFSFAPVTLNLGQTLDFVVGNNGNYLFGGTPISVVISPIPEPSSAILILLGAAAIAVRRGLAVASVRQSAA